MQWITIDNFDSYQVSNNGLVRSIDRFTTNHQGLKALKGVLLKQFISGGGYLFVCLSKDGKQHNKRIHKLVAEHFIGNKYNGLVVHHIDGNKLNNSYINLEYVSKQKNTQEYYKSIGKSVGSVPLNDIPNIIDRVNKGEQCYDIALEYNVSRNDIAVLCKIIALTGKELTI